MTVTKGHTCAEYALCGVLLLIGAAFFCVLTMAPDVLADFLLAIPHP